MNDKQYLKTLLVSETQLKNESFIQKNVSAKVLRATLQKVQNEKLKPVLGINFYDEILKETYEKINTTGYVLSEGLTILLTEYIQPYLIHTTISELIISLEYRLTNKGIKKLNDANSSNITIQELKLLKDKYENEAINYKSALIHFLDVNDLGDGYDRDILFEATGVVFDDNSNVCPSSKKDGIIRVSKGWTAIYTDEEYNGKIIRKLKEYINGEGEPPTNYIGMYLGQFGYTFNKDEALDYRSQNAGDKHYTHEEPFAKTEWQITHNLGKKASVSVVDYGDNIILCEVQYIDLNSLVLKFNFPVNGMAYLN